MKKRIFIVCGFVATALSFAAIASLSNKNLNENLFEANVDALASWEMPWSKPRDCYNTISAIPAMQVYYCPECRYISGKGEENTLSKCYR